MLDDKITGSILGYVAGSFILISNLIQIKKIIKHKSAKGLSMTYLLIFIIVCILYMTSGILINVQYVFLINLLNLLEIFTLIGLKIYYQKKNNSIINQENISPNNIIDNFHIQYPESINKINEQVSFIAHQLQDIYKYINDDNKDNIKNRIKLNSEISDLTEILHKNVNTIQVEFDKLNKKIEFEKK